MPGGAQYVLKAGKVLSVVNGLAVLKPALDVKSFRQGLPLVNASGRRVGSANDVIGNVNSPYLLVKLRPGAAVAHGEELYLIVTPPRRGRRHHRR
ncbi:MAG: hypothetical protein RXQ79_04825 [Acidilobus sp.]